MFHHVSPDNVGPLMTKFLDDKIKMKWCEQRDWTRIEDQFTRINACMVNMISSLDTIPRIGEDQPDDPIKASKKQLEFSTRFTRNYLCDLRRQMNNIKKFIEQPDSLKQTCKGQNVFHCFALSFQTVLQAFLTIEKNLRHIIFTKLPPQITEFLNYFGDLCAVTNATYWDGSSEKLTELEDMNSLLVIKLKENEDNLKKAEDKKKEKQQPILKAKSEIKKLPVKKCKNELSMYKSSTFERLWKKKSKALAKIKFGNKQEMQLKLEKNVDKPIIEKPKEKNDDNESAELSVENGGNNGTVRQKRKNSKPVSENEMKTMVESVSPQSVISSESESEEKPEVGNNYEIIDQSVEVKVKTSVETISGPPEEQFQMGPVMDEAFKTMFNHIMSQIMNNIDPTTTEEVQDEVTRNSVIEEVKKSNFREDNVQLICIVDNS